MSDVIIPILVAAIVAGVAAVSNIWIAKANNKQRDLERQQDREAAKEISDKAEVAASKADEAAGKAAEGAALILKTNQEIASSAVETKGQIKAVHTLVNSQTTALKRSELQSTERELQLLRDKAETDEADGREVKEETKVAIKTAEDTIRSLKAELIERQEKDKLAKAQVEESAV